MRVAGTLRNHVGFQATCEIGCLITLTTWVASDPKRTTQDRKLMVKEPRTNGGPGSLSCWKGRSTAEPFHYRSLGFGRPRSI
jgi:hypothetical protein